MTHRAALRSIAGTHPHRVWHPDLTIVPTHFGFWVPWVPFSWLQCWPFAYWVAVVVDHFSRKAIAVESFENCPTSQSLTAWLDVIIHSIGQGPRYIVSDQGSQFGEDYRDCASRAASRRDSGRSGSMGQSPLSSGSFCR